MKKYLAVLLCLALALGTLSGCADVTVGQSQSAADSGSPAAAAVEAVKGTITLRDSGSSSSAGGVAIDGGTVTIRQPGEYVVTGTLSNGQLIVNTGENPGEVVITLDNADITNPTDAAIYIPQAKKVELLTAEGSRNRLCSGSEELLSQYADTNSGAVIYAEDDLDLGGSGSLEIFGYINNGITCKDDLDLEGGAIAVIAANNGIRGSESVELKGADVTVTCGNDGIKTSSAAKEGKGFVTIESGNVAVVSGGDGIQAETVLTVNGGNISVQTTGNSETASCKGLKGNTDVVINGGAIAVSADDHALHSAAALSIRGGTLSLVSASRKGIDATGDVTVSGGELSLRAADDGITSDTAVTVSGGTLSLRCGGKGIKSGKNITGFGSTTGSILFAGGETRISAKDDALKCGADMALTGGSLFALGNSSSLPRFAEGGRPYLAVSVSGTAGSSVTVSLGGETLGSMDSTYAYHTLLFSNDALSSGTSYSVSGINGTVEAAA